MSAVHSYFGSVIDTETDLVTGKATASLSGPRRSFLRAHLDDSPIVLGGSGNPGLARAVASQLELKLGELKAEKFADGETQVAVRENVRNRDVYLIQPTCAPANDNLIELYLTLDALKRAGAGRITVIMPYFGYQRQERLTEQGDPISAKAAARLVEMAGADRAILVDIHAAAEQGFFEIPCELLSAAKSLAQVLAETLPSANLVVASPDIGGAKRAEVFAEYLGAPLAIIHKHRDGPDQAEVRAVVGDVAGRNVVIVDDMISTGTSVVNAAMALKAQGATSVSVVATHAVLADGAVKRLEESLIDAVYVTDTIPLEGNSELAAATKMHIVSIAPVLANAIVREHNGARAVEM